MTTDVKQLVEFAQKMDWEGGLIEMIQHGYDTTGDTKLDVLMEKLEAAYDAAAARWRVLSAQHYDAIWGEDAE